MQTRHSLRKANNPADAGVDLTGGRQTRGGAQTGAATDGQPTGMTTRKAARNSVIQAAATPQPPRKPKAKPAAQWTGRPRDMTGESTLGSTRSGTRNAMAQAAATPQPTGKPQAKPAVRPKGGPRDMTGESAYTTLAGTRKAMAQAAATPQPTEKPQANAAAQPEGDSSGDRSEIPRMTTRRGARNAIGQAAGTPQQIGESPDNLPQMTTRSGARNAIGQAGDTPQETGVPPANAAARSKVGLLGGLARGVRARKSTVDTRALVVDEKSKGKARMYVEPSSGLQVRPGPKEKMTTRGASRTDSIDRRAPVIGEKSRSKARMDVEPSSGVLVTPHPNEQVTTRATLGVGLIDRRAPIIGEKSRGKQRVDVEPDSDTQVTPGQVEGMTTRGSLKKAAVQEPEAPPQKLQIRLKPTLIAPARDKAPTTKHAHAISLAALSSDREGGDHEVLARIREGIHYVSRLAPDELPAVDQHFILPSKPQTTALRLLREASNKGLATFIWSSDREECYALGVPPAPHSRPFPSGLGAQWWAGKTPGEIKAGPFATDREARTAQGVIGRRVKRKKSGLRLKAEEQNLKEALRRQEAGECMFGEAGVMAPSSEDEDENGEYMDVDEDD